MTILVTGGAGFIGSHTVVELVEAGHTPIILDTFANSERSVVEKLQELTGRKISCLELDVRDTDRLSAALQEHKVDAVIHFAALKAVGESVDKPLEYYDNNVGGLMSVLTAMQQTGVNQLVFSSSCTVYGDPDKLPVTEESPIKPATNPYGATKQIGEQIITDVCKNSPIKAVMLRYFNPIGAHPSALIGELPIGPPNCLVPYLTQATAKVRDPLTVFGNDYDTPDGTCIRDYIHVTDVAKAHVSALAYLDSMQGKTDFFNIGTGIGSSVMEVIDTFEERNKTKVPYEFGPRRQGDVPINYASPKKAVQLLNWKAEKTLADALEDAWRWQQTL